MSGLPKTPNPRWLSLRQNLAALKISRGFTLEDRGVGAMLQRLGKLTEPVDLVFLDPPYEAEDEYSGTLQFFWQCSWPGESCTTSPRHRRTQQQGETRERYGALEHTRLVKQGDAALSFFGFPAVEQSLHPDAAQ